MGKYRVLTDFTSEELTERLRKTRLTSEQKEVLRAIVDEGVHYGHSSREINKSGESLVFAMLERREYEEGVDIVVNERLPKNKRKLAFDLASIVYWQARNRESENPESLDEVRALLVA